MKPYSPSASYKIYAWNDTQKLTGTWPGVALTEKDSDGNYVVKFDNVDEVSIILSSGSGQTADITGVRDGATIEITNEVVQHTSLHQSQSLFHLMNHSRKKQERFLL
ncbi:hypothetical protein DW745_00270 [Ruminococcus sp. AM28-29LB]|nr:hypothetical protein DW745_00270 [Ruminococcus sp. AM28-29LB]